MARTKSTSSKQPARLQEALVLHKFHQDKLFEYDQNIVRHTNEINEKRAENIGVLREVVRR